MRQYSSMIAKERLATMLSREKQQIDGETMEVLRREIGNIILRYIDIDLEHIDVKIILKEYKNSLHM